MVIVDDHLALLALAGQLADLGLAGPVVTTYGFQYRMVRALTDSARSGSLSRRLAEPAAAVGRAVRPPADRLVVLDPRASLQSALGVASRHPANLLLAEVVGAALHHRAAIRVTPKNTGRTWTQIMDAEGIDFSTIGL